jgi:hypothetical protein
LRITTPVLPRQTLEKVLATIRQDISTGEVRVDNPTQNLESYFLDVVAKARAANETSGAQSGAHVAEYLRGGETATDATDKVLEKLALPQAAQSKAPSPTTAEAKPTVNERKLDALAHTPSSASPAPTAETKPEVKPADLSKADEKLSSLLGGKK